MEIPSLASNLIRGSFSLYRKTGDILVGLLSTGPFEEARIEMESFRDKVNDMNIQSLTVNIHQGGRSVLNDYVRCMTISRKTILHFKNFIKRLLNTILCSDKYDLWRIDGKKMALADLKEYDCLIYSTGQSGKSLNNIEKVMCDLSQSLKIPVVKLNDFQRELKDTHTIRNVDEFVSLASSLAS